MARLFGVERWRPPIITAAHDALEGPHTERTPAQFRGTAPQNIDFIGCNFALPGQNVDIARFRRITGKALVRQG